MMDDLVHQGEEAGARKPINVIILSSLSDQAYKCETYMVSPDF